MGRGWAAVSAAVAAMVCAGCGSASTGVDVHAHMAAMPFDELRFGVVLVPPPESSQLARTIVDPETRGRFQGPFTLGDQDVVIYLKEDVADQMINCGTVALLQGAIVASGATEVVVQPETIIDVDVYLSPAATQDGSGPSLLPSSP